MHILVRHGTQDVFEGDGGRCPHSTSTAICYYVLLLLTQWYLLQSGTRFLQMGFLCSRLLSPFAAADGRGKKAEQQPSLTLLITSRKGETLLLPKCLVNVLLRTFSLMGA